jgi:NifU-like protein involved in Fe-S cluster formation
MPCSDSSSSIALKLDQDERFVSFEFAKITCGREITAETGYNTYCTGKSLPQILTITFPQAARDLHLQEEETQFILYLEWDALRSAIARYLGVDNAEIDKDRCQITSIEQQEDGVEIAQVILPPRELPKILPCNLADT